ncbi:MAG TPA: YdcF family protein [Actinomycetota bacterium]|nr:YdcF family protein [Actinomycetota bacterium]
MLRKIVVAVLLLGLTYLGTLAFLVWEQSRDDEVRSSDAIVVLGAAQYDGAPSPVFRARLNHAAFLFETDVSNLIIVTGGKQPGDRFTESEAGANYLLGEKGIASERILTESEGTTTLESLRGVARIADQEGIDSVLLVSDPLHSRRIKTMALDLGFDSAYTSPASYVELNRSRSTKVRELLHEVASLLAYQWLDR